MQVFSSFMSQPLKIERSSGASLKVVAMWLGGRSIYFSVAPRNSFDAKAADF